MRLLRIVDIAMRLPAVHQHSGLVSKRIDGIADDELGVGSLDFQKHMTMRVGVAHQRPVHIEKCDPAKGSVRDS